MLPRLQLLNKKKVRFGKLCLAYLVFSFAVLALALAVPGKKKLTAENIMDLLSSGVAPQRITHLVLERGVDFEMTQRLEQAFRDGGADPTLVMALKAQGSLQVGLQPPPSKPAAAPTKTSEPSVPPGTTHTRLHIRSKPGGVTIFVDDELKGVTDPDDGHLEIVGLKPGKHRLRATCEGFQDLDGPVEVAAGEVVETPVWLARVEAPAVPAALEFVSPPGKKFLVRHTHKAIEGLGGEGFCQGWMVVNVGYVRYLSTDSPHKYLMNTSEIRDVKAGSNPGAFTLRLDFGRRYEFVAVDEKGRAVGAGPVLTEIRYSMGQ